MPHILFSGIAPTVGDTAIGQSILARLNERCGLPLRIHSTHPEIFARLPEAANAQVHGRLPQAPLPALRSPMAAARLNRLLADLRETGGARTLPPEIHRALREALENCAGVVLQGGPNWNDRWIGAKGAIQRWLFAEAAGYYGAPVFHIGVSCGPFRWSWPRRLWLRALARAALSRHETLIVRDGLSATALADLGARTTVVPSTDAAIFLEPRANPVFAPVERAIAGETQRPRLAVCVRDLQPRYGYSDAQKAQVWKGVACVLDRVQREHATVFFLGTDYAEQPEKASDLAIARRIQGWMTAPGSVVLDTDVWDASALKHLYGLFDALLSMRLHPSILALGQGTPCLVIAYDRKCEDFLGGIGRGEWALPFAGFDPEDALARLRAMLDDPDLRADTRRRMADLVAAHAQDWDGVFTALNDRATAIRAAGG